VERFKSDEEEGDGRYTMMESKSIAIGTRRAIQQKQQWQPVREMEQRNATSHLVGNNFLQSADIQDSRHLNLSYLETWNLIR
jgi:hypothetical protein